MNNQTITVEFKVHRVLLKDQVKAALDDKYYFNQLKSQFKHEFKNYVDQELKNYLKRLVQNS